MAGRKLDPTERALWSRVAATVRPLPGQSSPLAQSAPPTVKPPRPAVPLRQSIPAAKPAAKPAAPPARRAGRIFATASLDGHWDRRLRKGLIRPDLSLDLHGHSLASAQALLDASIARGLLRGARVLLVIAGRLRPGADRLPLMHGDPRPRGAIRASLADWLANSPHADQIIALRPARTSHGGAGAVYVILRRSHED